MSTMPKERREYLKTYKREKLHRIPLDMPIEEYERMKSHAESRGESVNGFIKRAIRETIPRDILPPGELRIKDKQDAEFLRTVRDTLLKLLTME